MDRVIFKRTTTTQCLTFAILAVLLPLSSTTFAETSDSTSSATAYLSSYIVDLGGLITAPAHFSNEDWLKTADIFAIGGVLFALDGNIRDAITDSKTSTTTSIANVIHPIGEWQVAAPAIVATYAFSYVIKDPHLGETALLSMESLVLSGIFVQALKTVTHRARPSQDPSAYDFSGPFSSSNHMSFPSGDVNGAFSVASVIAHEYPDQHLVAFISYGLAGLVGLERMELNKHYASDVFFGAALGYFTGSYIVKQHGHPTEKGLTLSPIVVDHGVGISANYQM